MAIRGINRNPTALGFATPTNAPFFVDSDDNTVYVIPAGTGSTAIPLVYGVASGVKMAAGTGTLVTGTVTIATGLSTVLGFSANISGTGAKSTGASEVSALQVASITTGAVIVQGFYNSPTTGAMTISASGTASFYWTALGT